MPQPVKGDKGRENIGKYF